MVEKDQLNQSSGRPLVGMRGGKQTWQLMLLGAIILASGLAMGVGVAMVFLRGAQSPPPPPVDKVAATVAARIAATCDLSEQQADKVREIVARRMEALNTIRNEMAGEVLAEHETMRLEMKEVLTAEQFAKWSSRLDEIQAKSWLRRRPRRPRRPDSGPSHRRPRSDEVGGRRSFERFDADGNGKLTQDEVPPRLWPKLIRMDANKDLAISPDEWKAHSRGPSTRPRGQVTSGPEVGR